MSQKHPWLADRMSRFDSSGIRRVFELGAKLKNPVNLSIGQPDFDAPESVKQAAVRAITEGKNGYSLTQGIPQLRERLQDVVDRRYGHADRKLFVTSGTSGGLMLAIMALVDPGDEVIIFDPYFVMYDALVQVAGGVPVYVDTYPDFHIDLARVEAAVGERTKLILFNTPANPTGAVAGREEVRGLAELAAARGIALLSDEIYREFCDPGAFVSPAEFNPETLVIEGFSKSHGIPGWRIGALHGPSALIDEMIKLQQYSFVCAPHPLQWAALEALDVDMSETYASYRRKRDMLYEGLKDLYEIPRAEGAFYLFPKAPWGTGTEFVEKAITEHGLLIIPGNVFSKRDTHFRISFAAADDTIARGIEILRKLAERP
ncbi:MAG: aminotransferase class I/II-fold pyridoxal phosphate-dependent enzyme [Planctomycetota bacterium]|nr:MAG: aminotransferase class I/II-fold pyridoxal phosphate-dependent enzyme [Planctomycetota bacterium]